MPKKTFTKGLDLLLGGAPEYNEPAPAQQPQPSQEDNRPIEELLQEHQARKETRGRKRVHPEGQDLNTGEVRKTFIMAEDLVNKLGWLSYWERKKMKAIANEMAQEYIARYEEKHGPIAPAPTNEND